MPAAVRAEQPSIDECVVFSETSVTLKSAAESTSAPTCANGSVSVGAGAETGSIWAGGSVFVGPYATTHDIHSGAAISVKATANVGRLHAFQQVQSQWIPAVVARPNLNHIHRTKGERQAGPLYLPPGTYGELTSATHDMIVLQSGTYEFAKLTLKTGTALFVEIAEDQPVFVLVEGDIVLGTGTQVGVIGGGAEHLFFGSALGGISLDDPGGNGDPVAASRVASIRGCRRASNA